MVVRPVGQRGDRVQAAVRTHSGCIMLLGVKARSGIAQAAALVTGLTALSAVLGFLRDVVIAGVFGAGAQLDAFLVAQGLMNLVLALIAGAMAKSTVPVLAAQISADGDSNKAAHTLSVVLTVTLTILGLGSLIMALAAPLVVTVLAPGFKGEQADLAASLTRIVLIATVLISGTNLLAAAAEAHRRFFWSAIQGLPFNLIMIVAAVVFGPRYGVYALAVGFVVGSAARLLCQFVPIHALKLRLRASWDLKDPAFRSIAKLIPPLLVGSALGNANTMVDRAVGSMVGEGTISALSYAWRIISLGQTLLVASLLTALYPAFGAAAGTRDLTEMRRLVGRGLSTVATVLLPVCGFLLVCSVPLVALVFEHGSFSPDDTQRTATAIVVVRACLIGPWLARDGGARLVRDGRLAPARDGLRHGHDDQCGRRLHPWTDLRYRRDRSVDLVVGAVRGGGQYLAAGSASRCRRSQIVALDLGAYGCCRGCRHRRRRRRLLPAQPSLGRRPLQRAAVGLRRRPDLGVSQHRRLVRPTRPRTPAARRGHRRSCAASPVVTSISSGRKLPGWTDAKS